MVGAIQDDIVLLEGRGRCFWRQMRPMPYVPDKGIESVRSGVVLRDIYQQTLSGFDHDIP